MLEDRFVELVGHSGVPYATYQRYTRRLLAQLDNDHQDASTRSEGREHA
jgi:hypothetical protein